MLSEVLCYIQNHFSSSTRDNIVTALTGCYSEDDIVAAKTLLYNLVDELPAKPEGLSRHIKRQASDNKKQLDCRDMLNLYRELDLAKVELPRFVAADLAHLPTVKPGEVDVYYMAVTVAKLTQQLERVSARLEALEKQKQSGSPPGPPLQAAPTDGPAPETPPGLSEQSASSSSSWAGVASNNAVEWKKVEAAKKRTPAPIRVKGSRSPEDVGEKLKTVPRRAVLAAYVGRLHPDTTEEELSQFLADEGVKGVVCKKLVSKTGTKFKTAAFYVTCSTDSRETFYAEKSWPDGVELRDWVYYNRH